MSTFFVSKSTQPARNNDDRQIADHVLLPAMSRLLTLRSPDDGASSPRGSCRIRLRDIRERRKATGSDNSVIPATVATVVRDNCTGQ